MEDGGRTQRRVVGRGGELCLCFRPSLLRLISAPAATRQRSCASPTEFASTPRLDQSTMWLRPGAKRARDRRTRGERERRETDRERLDFISRNIIHIYQFNFWSKMSNLVAWELYQTTYLHHLSSILKGTQSPLEWHGVRAVDKNPLSAFALFKPDWTFPSQMIADC